MRLRTLLTGVTKMRNSKQEMNSEGIFGPPSLLGFAGLRHSVKHARELPLRAFGHRLTQILKRHKTQVKKKNCI